MTPPSKSLRVIFVRVTIFSLSLAVIAAVEPQGTTTAGCPNLSGEYLAESSGHTTLSLSTRRYKFEKMKLKITLEPSGSFTMRVTETVELVRKWPLLHSPIFGFRTSGHIKPQSTFQTTTHFAAGRLPVPRELLNHVQANGDCQWTHDKNHDWKSESWPQTCESTRFPSVAHHAISKSIGFRAKCERGAHARRRIAKRILDRSRAREDKRLEVVAYLSETSVPADTE